MSNRNAPSQLDQAAVEADKTIRVKSVEEIAANDKVAQLQNNIGGIGLKSLAIWMLVMTACASPQKPGNPSIDPPGAPSPLNPGQPDSPDSKEQLKIIPIVRGISPDYENGNYNVLGNLKNAKAGDAGEVILVFEKDGQIIQEVTVRLIAKTNRGTALGKANIDPRSVEGENSEAYVKGETDPNKRMKLVPAD